MSVMGEPPRITNVRLENIRGFRDLDIPIAPDESCRGPCTLFIGKNGTGKTTILRSIALGFAGIDGAVLLREPLGRPYVSTSAHHGTIAIETSKGPLPALLLSAKMDSASTIRPDPPNGAPWPEPELWVFGYGAGRSGQGSVPLQLNSPQALDSVRSLFNYGSGLVDAELTLRRLRDYLDEGSYEGLLAAITKALGLNEMDQFDLPLRGGVELSGPTFGRTLRLEALPDGFRLTMAWMMDMMARALQSKAITADGDIEGILLLDEVEQHLHPSMQLEMLPRLRQQFPKLQIFATTHSPLVALSVRPEELVSLRRNDDVSVDKVDVPNYAGYSAEDMLVDSALFGTKDVYAPEMNDRLRRYRELVAIPPEKRDREQSATIKDLAAVLLSRTPPQDRESESTRLIRELLAKRGI